MLDKIREVKIREVAALKEAIPLGDLQSRCEGPRLGKDFRRALEGGDCAVIAELKKHSPSRGSLREDADPQAVAAIYEKNGAAAISVLTDRTFFHGSAEFLREVKNAVRLPVLRKDFIIDPYQIYETRLMGADALLLISGLLTRERLRDSIGLARSLEMWPLVEVHELPELEDALEAGAEIIGINNRDLKTFATNLEKTLELAPHVPPDRVLVSESGIQTRKDIEMLMAAGVHVFLVGEALMVAADPGRKLRELRGREEAGCRR